jgi:hypothetical protein
MMTEMRTHPSHPDLVTKWMSSAHPVPCVRAAKAPFAQAVLICGKCIRRLGPRGKSVRKALKKALKRRRPLKIRLVETRCMDLCPKRRVVLASAHTLAERRLLVVEPGVGPDAALDRLLAAPPIT